MDNQTIIVKKIKKGGHGHHGGAWKVAFADFVTAMMAFFLLLWLLASTTTEMKAGISDYFANPAGPQGPGGASTAMIQLGGVKDPEQGKVGEDFKTGTGGASDKEIKDALAKEKKRFEDLMSDIKAKVESSPDLKEFKDQLKLDITSEGLRIQVVDKENRPMFDLGSAYLKSYTKVILHEVAKTINAVPNRISLTGHTDAARFSDREDYSNWELSADRANASRRELIFGGLSPDKVAKVVGLASSVPFDRKDPFNPSNRRISIIVLNKATEAALLNDGVQDAGEEQTKEEKPKSIMGSIQTPREEEKVEQEEVAPVVVVPRPVASKPIESKPVEPKKAASEKPAVKIQPVKKAPAQKSKAVEVAPPREDEKPVNSLVKPIAPINPIQMPFEVIPFDEPVKK